MKFTRRGWVPVEVTVGDRVASRDQFADPVTGAIQWQPVEAVFRPRGRILHLHFADGELIRTTPEHPFFVYDKGWTAAGALKAGDRVATRSDEWVPVAEVFDTEQWETVYNLRVAEYHTYFVGEEGWGWAAWAHNAYYTPTEVTIGPLANQWFLQDQTNSPTRGLEVMDRYGRVKRFTTRAGAQAELATLTAANRLTYVPTQTSTDTPLRCACDDILAAIGPTAIMGTSIHYTYAVSQPLAGQEITDVDILSPNALIEAKSDGVSLAVLRAKVASYNQLFDPAVCATPLTPRTIIFYCEGLSRARLANFKTAFREYSGPDFSACCKHAQRSRWLDTLTWSNIMIDCPIFASSDLTLRLVLEVVDAKLPNKLRSVQPDKLIFDRMDGTKAVVVQDLRLYTNYDNDSDWLDFTNHVPLAGLDGPSCSRLNVEHYDFEEVKPLIIALSQCIEKLWVLLPGHNYVSGSSL